MVFSICKQEFSCNTIYYKNNYFSLLIPNNFSLIFVLDKFGV